MSLRNVFGTFLPLVLVAFGGVMGAGAGRARAELRPEPQLAAPERVASERAAPERVVPERAAPERVAPERPPPERVAPERPAPEQPAEVGSRSTEDATRVFAGQRVPPRAPSGADLSRGLRLESVTRARLDFLCERLDLGGKNLRLWWGIWVGVHGTMGVIQAVMAASSHRVFGDPSRARGFRNSLATGATTSGVGLVAVLASYPAGFRGCGPVRRLRDGSAEGDARALALAEKRLAHTAKNLRFGRSWLTHVAGVLVNLAAGLVLWLAFDQPLDGGIQLLAGTAVAQAQIWTQPTAAITDHAAYLRRFPTPPTLSLEVASQALLTARPTWRFLPFPGGLGLECSF